MSNAIYRKYVHNSANYYNNIIQFFSFLKETMSKQKKYKNRNKKGVFIKKNELSSDSESSEIQTTSNNPFVHHNPRKKHKAVDHLVPPMRFKKSGSPKKDNSNKWYYNQMPPNERSMLVNVAKLEVTHHHVPDQLDVFYEYCLYTTNAFWKFDTLTKFESEHYCHKYFELQPQYKQEYMAVNITRQDKCLSMVQQLHHMQVTTKQKKDSSGKLIHTNHTRNISQQTLCAYPDIGLAYLKSPNKCGYFWKAFCRNCGWLCDRNITIDRFIQFEDNKTFNQHYLSQVEGARQIAIGFNELTVFNCLYNDINTIKKNAWSSYSVKANEIAQFRAMQSIHKAQQKIHSKYNGEADVSFDVNYANGRKRHDSKNASALWFDQNIQQVIHFEIASKRKGGNFEGSTRSMEPYMYHEGTRKCSNRCIKFTNVAIDGDGGVKRIHPLTFKEIKRYIPIETPPLSGDSNHWQLKAGTRLQKAVAKLLKAERSKYAPINKKHKSVSDKKQYQRWTKLIKSVNLAWGKRFTKRVAELVNKYFGVDDADEEYWTYASITDYIKCTVLAHYCPKSELHDEAYGCRWYGNWWCIRKHRTRRNWIATSDVQLPVDPTGKLQEIVMGVLNY